MAKYGRDRMEIMITSPRARNVLMNLPDCRLRRCYIDDGRVKGWGFYIAERQVDKILTYGRWLIPRRRRQMHDNETANPQGE